jgi:hypothetical protein
MKLVEATPFPKGVFRLQIFRCGRLIESVCERNLWVVNGSQAVAQLVGGTVTGNSITQIGFGTNGSAPTVGNTALTGAYTKALGTVSYPASGQVSWVFTLGSTEANGLAILELGLLTAGGALAARKVRATPIYKSSAVTLAGSWTIQF